jgi:hypothetical protein
MGEPRQYGGIGRANIGNAKGRTRLDCRFWDYQE